MSSVASSDEDADYDLTRKHLYLPSGKRIKLKSPRFLASLAANGVVLAELEEPSIDPFYERAAGNWELAEREWTVANTTRREKLDLVVGHRAARIKEASEEKAPKPDGEPLAKKHSRAQAFRAKVKEEDRAHYQEKSQILAQLCEARCDPPSWRLPACLPACWRLGRTGCTANMTEQKINVELTSRIGPDGLVHHVVSSMAGPPPKKQRNSDGREPEPRGPSDPPSEISSATWRARKKQLVKEAEALQEAGDISQMDLTLIRQE
jgi:hypothetical protein